MLKSILKCTIAGLCLLSSSVNAQDFCCCDYNPFSGFYIGGNIGVSSHTAHRHDLDGFLTDNSGWSSVDTAFVGGLQIGYDYQCGSSVFGLLVDWDPATHRHTLRDNPNEAAINNFLKHDLTWLSTIRARAGLAVSNSLLYVTGGAAVARLKSTWNSGADNFTHNHHNWGWVGGVGAEYKIASTWNVGAEFLYFNFSNSNKSFTNAGGTTFTFGHSDTTMQGRLFVNWSLSDMFSSYR